MRAAALVMARGPRGKGRPGGDLMYWDMGFEVLNGCAV